ncbi:hypothetical protein F66182_10801 [Fusarium sp. NRRL 66182]|nr:hypothetical protein F66182_10801 [Fusarium sp. NRRL 66182]
MAPLRKTLTSQPKAAANKRHTVKCAPKRAPTQAAALQPPCRTDMILAMNDPYMQQIIDGTKTYEFRKYNMAGIQRIWFYRTAPHSAITHICPVNEAVTRKPCDQPLPKDGLGNKEYNQKDPDYEGYDYAYRINAVYEINAEGGQGITWAMMRDEHGMKIAPRGRVRVPESMIAQYSLEGQNKWEHTKAQMTTFVSCSMEQSMPIAYDLASHHALGGGRRTEVNVIIQPGTLCSLARRLLDEGQDVSVTCDLWDRARGEQITIDGAVYQKSLRDKGEFQKHLPGYVQIINELSSRYRVHHRIRMEEEFMSNPEIPDVLREIVIQRDFYAKVLAPERGSLAIRASCPECGLVDKYGTRNVCADDGSTVTFKCPSYGFFTCNTQIESNRFQFNCQLFNLVLGLFYERTPYNWIAICGNDYAGFWQEQLLWRFLSKPAIIVYTPLISDWSGSKISKSLYLQDTAYQYLRHSGQEYLLNYEVCRRENKDLGILWKEVEFW